VTEVTQGFVPEELSEALNRSGTDQSQSFPSANTGSSDSSGESTKRTLFVVVVGGLTFLEVAAFRFLSKDPNFPYRIIMGTTKLITGSTLLKSMKHNVKI
jgi:hypothetical protein